MKQPINHSQYTYLVGALINSIKAKMDSVGDKMMMHVSDVASVGDDGKCHGLIVDGFQMCKVADVQTSLAGNIVLLLPIDGVFVDEETGEADHKVMFHRYTVYRDGQLTKPYLRWCSQSTISTELFDEELVSQTVVDGKTVYEIADVAKFIGGFLDATKRNTITENYTPDMFVFNDPRIVDSNSVVNFDYRICDLYRQLVTAKVTVKVLKHLVTECHDYKPTEDKNEPNVHRQPAAYANHDQLVTASISGLSNIPSVEKAVAAVEKGTKSVSNLLVSGVVDKQKEDLMVDGELFVNMVQTVLKGAEHDVKLLTDAFGAEMNHYRYIEGGDDVELVSDVSLGYDIEKKATVKVSIKK